MVHLLWILPGILSFGVGWFFVSYLTVHPLRMRLHLASILVLSLALVAVLVVGFEGWQLLLASLLSLAFFLAGYAVKTHQVLSREDETPLPAITRQKGDPGDGHTAVVYLTHGEPETYNPMAWIGTFQELDATGAPFVPWIARPFFLRKLREEYLHVGESNHRQNHLRMVQALEAGFRKAGDAMTRFYLAFLDDDPRPGAATIQAIKELAEAYMSR